jgi:hypothetical protein
MLEHNQGLCLFRDDPLIELTNNRAERRWRPIATVGTLNFGNLRILGTSSKAVTISVIETGVLNDAELAYLAGFIRRPLTPPASYPGQNAAN